MRLGLVGETSGEGSRKRVERWMNRNGWWRLRAEEKRLERRQKSSLLRKLCRRLDSVFLIFVAVSSRVAS